MKLAWGGFDDKPREQLKEAIADIQSPSAPECHLLNGEDLEDLQRDIQRSLRKDGWIGPKSVSYDPFSEVLRPEVKVSWSLLSNLRDSSSTGTFAAPVSTVEEQATRWQFCLEQTNLIGFTATN
ncbi:hypothetical protein scyTo_0015038 [Scyliorhinus torazame]|uniref:Uncharacterized protein n=1 Tax=Scyliorhinus torazame TaxID=75743 RepID=A0A401P0U7_SCYTO|nr:hypothetical protein [Scyliorhinus torazame]